MKSKQVLILRKDLNMRKGKMCSQAAHASLKVFFDLMGRHDDGSMVIDGDHISGAMLDWMEGSFTKICVSVGSEQELLEIYKIGRAHV